jgi:Transposase DNA-binding/Transposase Tn5 dimerisation domain
MASWIDQELAGCQFADVRLRDRFMNLVERLSEGIGETIPMACQDWANTKAAYRFLSNNRVSENEILSGHFQSTRDRFLATDGVALILHDTTEFSYQRERPELIGNINVMAGRRDDRGRPLQHTVCGILMHSSLVITTEGLPLGVAAIKFWTRKEFKGTNALKKHINPTRVPIEEKESVRWLDNIRQTTTLLNDPSRCVHIGDRESDTYELFCTAQDEKTHFLVRTCVDRLAEDGQRTISKVMKSTELKALHVIEVRDRKGQVHKTTLKLCYRRIRVLPPIGKKSRYPELHLTVIYAQEQGTSAGRERIDWKLITDLPVSSPLQAIEKLEWYASRWKIETFHKVLKSGCKAESSKLRTADRLVNLIAVFCILSWRIFWLTMLNRATSHGPSSIAFTETERRLLDRLVPSKKNDPSAQETLSNYITKVAKLGGYLARAGDSPPGNTVMWRGISRLTDIAIGYELAKDVGN